MKLRSEVALYDYKAIVSKFTAHDTQFNVVQGKINALVSESEITTLINGKQTMYSKLAQLELTANGLKTQVSDIEKQTISNSAGSLISRLSTVEQTADAITTRVSNVESNGITTSNLVSAINQKAGNINISVFKNDASYAKSSEVTSAINVSAKDITSTVSKNYATKSEVKQTADGLTVTINKKLNTADFATTLKANASTVRLYTTTLTWKATNSSLTENGTLTATNAVISGKVTATSGAIGGWTINNSSISGAITSGDTTWTTSINKPTATNTNVFKVTNGTTNTFTVTAEGKLTATNAVISGKVTATSGTIGGWTIGAAAIAKTVGTYTTSLRAVSDTSAAVFRVNDGTANTFYVRADGYLYAKSGNFTGTIKASAGSISKFNLMDFGIFADGGKYRIFMQQPRNDQWFKYNETWCFATLLKDSTSTAWDTTGVGTSFIRADGWGGFTRLSTCTFPDKTARFNVDNQGNVRCKTITCETLNVTKKKNRVVKGSDGIYREMYAFEAANPYFMDCGYGKTGKKGAGVYADYGEAQVSLDTTFLDIVVRMTGNKAYFVFVQPLFDEGMLFVTNLQESFKVVGTPNCEFFWMAFVKQKDISNERMTITSNSAITASIEEAVKWYQ